MFGRLLNFEVQGQKIIFRYEEMTTRIEVISAEIINVFAFAGMPDNINLPSISVTTPTGGFVPLTITEAPMIGKPSSSEITVPVTFEICAFTKPIPMNR